MEHFFDLREFILLLVKKSRLFIILAVIFGLLGGLFGFFKTNDELYISTASASVNLKNEATADATALTSVMASIKDTVSGEFFYTGIVNAISQSMDTNEFTSLFGTAKQPSIATLKEVIKLYVNGNLVLVDVTGDKELAAEASTVARKFVIERLRENINSVIIEERTQQMINQSLKTGDSARGNALKFGILGFAGGLVLAALWIFFFDVMSVKVKEIDDLKKYRLPVFDFGENKLSKKHSASLPETGTVSVAKRAALCLLSALLTEEDGSKKEKMRPILIGVSSSSSSSLSSESAAQCKEIAASLAEAFASMELTAERADIGLLSKNNTLEKAREYCGKLRSTADITILTIESLSDSQAGMAAAACCDGILLIEQRSISRTDNIDNTMVLLGDLTVKPLGFGLLPSKQ